METSPLNKVLLWIAGGMQPPHPRRELYITMGKPMRRILVTGASGRLGQALQAQPGFDFIPVSGVDLSNFENTAAVISGCGPFDGIVNLAGGWAPDDQQVADEMFGKNFLTALNATGAALQYGLRDASHPRIVFIGAASALGTDRNSTPYNQSKLAVHNLAKMLAKELPPKFKVNVIAPTQITDYDYVAKQIVSLLLPNQTQTGEIFVV
jgi:NAD(P)-dependent dehydrogenase (short-subunit alcohol dehydrogenase family)